MKRKNKWSALLLCALALVAWILALFLAQSMGTLAAPVPVRWTEEGGGASPDQLRRVIRYAQEDGREDLPALTLWREDPSQLLTDEGEGRSASAAVLSCYGEGGDLYPAGFLFGNYPPRGDAQGIALDTAAAYALWGGTGAPGQTVRWNGNTYYLRGVFEGDKGLAIVQDGDDSAVLYPNLLLRMPNGGGAAEAQAFLTSAGLSGGEVTDAPFLSWCLSALAGLPGLLLALALVLRLFRRGWRLRHSPILLTQYLLPGAAGCALTLWAAGFPWEIPAKLIPTRFSDLEFWSRLFDEVGRSVQSVFTGSMTTRDLALWTPALLCLLTLPIACALMALALPRAGAADGKDLLLGGLSAMGIAFVAALALANPGGVALPAQVWLLPPLWLCADLALRVHAKCLEPHNPPVNPVGPGLCPCRPGEEATDETHQADQATLGAAGL